MNQETALWILGASVPAVIGWCATAMWLLLTIRRDTCKLVTMLEHPEETGIGTSQTNRAIEEANRTTEIVIRDNTRAMRELTHYVRWLAERQTNEQPPPFVDEVGQ